MRNLKKFLALVLAMMMTLSLMVTVNAATSSADLNLSDSNAVSPAFLEDIQVLTGMEVIKGYPDGSFKPATEINRHQMATFIYRMTTGDTGNLKDRYLSEIAAEKFPDVKADDDYAGYIGYCWVNGFIAGFPDGTFRPMNKVTGYQALVMILRGMGYNNPNDNFTGSDWQSLAMSRARMNNLLVKIDKSVYSGTFSRPAPRELVAEMVFQGLIQPQVTWTTAMGYQKYGMEGGVLSNILNPTLGYENFGLTNHKGIVVGNQGSGEKVTKVGFSLDVSVDKGLNIGDEIDGTAQGWTVTGSVNGAKFNDKLVPEAYYYDSGLAVNTARNGVDGNVTLSFNWESDLKLFNHAVDVWYDYRGTSTTSADLAATGGFNEGSVTFRDNLKTYAMFDRVQNTSVNTAAWAYDTTNATTGNAAVMDMDNVFGATANTLYNYAFAPMQRESAAAAGEYIVNGTTMPSKSAASPIQANNGNDTYSTTETTDMYPLYLAIDNTGDKAADVIISLNLTMTKIVQDNNTQAPLTTGVLSQNGSSTVNTGYFDLWDQKTPVNGTPKYSDIADAALLNSDGTTLGKYVSAMTITGTTAPQNDGTQDATVTGPGAATADGTQGNTGTVGINSTYYYQVNELTKYVTGTMVKYDQTTDKVWATVDGQLREIERSVFALTTDGSFQGNEHVFAPRPAGTYRFYLDEEGKWLFWEVDTQTSEFVYGTYVNYTTNEFGGLFNYPFVYVNAAGEKNQTGYVTHLDMNIANGWAVQPYDGDMNNAAYTAIQLPKRTNTGDNSSGFVPGAYVGYTMTKNDKNEVSIDADVTGTKFRQASTASGDFGDSTATNGGKTTINANSVALTAHPVTDEGNLFLTNRTKFVIVDGAGTETQKVDIYNGIAELLGNNLSVTIDAVTGLTATTAGNFLDSRLPEVGTNPYEMVYYSTEEDPYSQNYYQMDKHIDTVFIPRVLVKWTANPGSGNLYFVGDETHGLIDAGTDATQFTFHQGTESRTLWIAGQLGGTNDRAVLNANVVGNAANRDTFYWLFDTGAKAKDGEPIYTINTTTQTPANAGSGLIGYYYDGSDVDNATAGNRTAASKTAITLGDSTGTTYLATTRNSQVAYIGGRAANTDLYNVQNATILNLNRAYTINNLGDLNEASSNASNLGVAVSCVLGEGKSVANIYVNFVAGT